MKFESRAPRLTIGDKVQLISGSFPMIVYDIHEDGKVECNWLDGYRMCFITLPAVCLFPVA